jgi:hypothetical protein
MKENVSSLLRNYKYDWTQPVPELSLAINRLFITR